MRRTGFYYNVYGKPAYYAPELRMREIWPDHFGFDVDAWQLGVTAVYLCTGRTPSSEMAVEPWLRLVQAGRFQQQSLPLYYLHPQHPEDGLDPRYPDMGTIGHALTAAPLALIGHLLSYDPQLRPSMADVLQGLW